MNLDATLVQQFVMAAHGDFDTVKRLYQQEPRLLTAIHNWGEQGGLEDGLGAASHVGNRPIAEFFLSHDVPTTICTEAMLGNVDKVSQLLSEQPALANARGAHGITVLFHAALSGNCAVAQALKEGGCQEGYSHAVHAALMFRHTEMVRWLLDNYPVDLTFQDFRGRTPLEVASADNDADMLAMLQRYHR